MKSRAPTRKKKPIRRGGKPPPRNGLGSEPEPVGLVRHRRCRLQPKLVELKPRRENPHEQDCRCERPDAEDEPVASGEEPLLVAACVVLDRHLDARRPSR